MHPEVPGNPLPETIAPDPGDLAELLDDLEHALTRQVELAQQQDFEAVLALAQAADQMLARAGAIAPSALRQHTDRLTRIRELHRRLRLIIAEHRQEVAQKRAQSKQGRAALHAYGR